MSIYSATRNATLSLSHSSPLLYNAGLVISCSLLMAVSAHISFPLYFTPVPITLQTFGVMLIALLLTPGVAFASLALYLLEGASGLPVFSPHGPGGIAQLFGPTGGYLLSYPFVAAAASALFARARRSSVLSRFGAAAGSLVFAMTLIFSSATLWMSTITRLAPLQAAKLTVLPFLPGDALKILAAAAIVSGLYRARPSLSSEI